MKITVTDNTLETMESPVLVVTCFKGEKKVEGFLSKVNDYTDGLLAQLLENGEISGKYKEFTFIHTPGKKIQRVLVMGLGTREEFQEDRLRSVMARAARNARRIRCHSLVVSSFIGIGINAERAAHLVVEGMQLGLYRFEKYQTSTERRRVFMDEIIFLPEGDNAAMLEKGAVAGGNLARATNFARDLVNEPANKLYPENFAELTKTVCEKSGISVEIYDEKWLEEKGMNLHLAVGRASKRPPRLVILRYAPPTAKKHVGLVGKGITFDTGGYQIKTDNSMWRMNSDMGGAAAVIGAVIAAADANLNVKITAALPMAENMIDGTGYLPGDVITSYSGKTVEILNTDAEGRLLLADSISWMVREEKVEQLIDIATLTGSIVMALGHQMSGLFSSNDQVAEDLQASGVKSGESLWRMPLHNDYLLQLKSNVADLENIGGRPAGSITAAMFLREFTDGIPWAHIDIAGTATMDSAVFAYYKCPYYPKEGATGVGTRLLFHYLEKNAC